MSKKVMLIAGVSGALVLILMGTGFFLLWKKVSTLPPAAAELAKQEAEAQAQAEGEKEGEDEEAKEPGPIVPLEPFIVNLADEGGGRYLRVSMQLELSDKELEKEMEKLLPKIRDSILMILPSKKSEDIRTSEGKSKVRDEIIVAINGSLTTGTVENLYFTEFVIQ
jgi:flagellar protein FliL